MESEKTPTAEQLVEEANARRSQQESALKRARAESKARRQEQIAAMTADRQRMENRIAALEQAIDDVQTILQALLPPPRPGVEDIRVNWTPKRS